MRINLHIKDLQSHFKSSSVQYADDTTIYETCKPKEIPKAQYRLNETQAKGTNWTNNSLAANVVKTKYILCASKRQYDFHQLKDQQIEITLGSTELKLDKEPRYLGMYLELHLTWENHFKHVLSSCYNKLSVPRKMKNFTTFKSRKI